MQHYGTKNIETKRLNLRKFSLDDALAVYKNWASDKEVAKYLTWKTHPNLKTTQNVVSEWVKNYSSHKYYKWAITLKENGNEPIGDISVVSLNEKNSTATIGYCIGKFWWHQGIMSEALNSVIYFLFNVVHINKIKASHDLKNINSGKVVQKCGMRFLKILYDVKNGEKLCDICTIQLIIKKCKIVYFCFKFFYY